MAPLTVTELEELAALMKQQAEKRFAPMVQTAPALSLIHIFYGWA